MIWEQNIPLCLSDALEFLYSTTVRFHNISIPATIKGYATRPEYVTISPNIYIISFRGKYLYPRIIIFYYMYVPRGIDIYINWPVELAFIAATLTNPAATWVMPSGKSRIIPPPPSKEYSR